MKNTGVILGQRDTDWIGGAIQYEVMAPDGNWRQFLSVGERQHSPGADTMSCVSFSALNAIEVQHKQQTGREVNYSDRFTAVMSGTTRQGNYLWKVADSIRKDGVLLEEDYPAPVNYTWDEYHQLPSLELINKAKLWLNNWEINYEWVDITLENMLYHLKHAPLQVVINNNTHAVLNFLTEQDVYNYFDQYEPFIKQTKTITWALKIVLRQKTMIKLIRKSGALEVWAIFGDKRYWVLDPNTLDRGTSIWGNWDTVIEDDPDKYKYGGAMFISNTDDPIP
jgi:hypothetical protein